MDEGYIKIKLPTEKEKKARQATITSQFTSFLETIDSDVKESVYLNQEILFMAVSCYFSDVVRYKAYSRSEKANRHKQSAYVIKWISKLKPIQILPNKPIGKNMVNINAIFSLYVGLSFVHPSIANNLPKKVFENLIYTIYYRNISGRQFTNVMIMLEHCFADKGLSENELSLSDDA